ncbi:glutamate dehydrogenase [Pseudonocardia hierapolitana]|uniref:Glutamate dehydrogenase n=1 Tax=Pseudonocardia hierapolitana TaxID=1128676 RepID=A0A561T5N7_9PSEU|nr:NAD-glutamate dehydrogenase [Pseudonocardia hierapolitana]TWF82399.1 glutamate dehydrogenase [Pseudonocardia hierapolitana]
MRAIPHDDRSEVIQRVRQYAAKRMGAADARLYLPLVDRYYERVAGEDLAARAVPDLFGTALAHLRLARRRQPGELTVAVCSPTFDADGFACPHTVVQVVADDMPFIPESLETELGRHGFGLHIALHPVFEVVRGASGELLAVLGEDEQRSAEVVRESFHHIEIDRQADPAVLDELRRDLVRVLGDVRAASEDQAAMRERAVSIAQGLHAEAPTVDPQDRAEAAEFLRWLAEDHFTFLGYREYELVPGPREEVLRAVDGSGLGILRTVPGTPHPLSTLPADVRRRLPEPVLLNITKANSRATVQRGTHLDYVGVKRIDENGRAVGERRFLGLYPRSVAKAALAEIPIARQKMRAVLDRAADPRHTYEAQVLVDILDGYPRDEVLQSTADELYGDAMAILELQHQQRLRLRVRRDGFGRFFSCFVDLPLGRLDEAARVCIRDTLMSAFQGVHAEESTLVTDSSVARLHFVIYVEPGAVADLDASLVEARLTSALRTWTDDLADALVEEFGEEQGVLLLSRYANAMPPGYQDDHTARTAVSDIRRLEALLAGDPPDGLAIHLYSLLDSIDPLPRLKLYRYGEPLMLSDVVPLLENMGTRVVDERPYEIRPAGAQPVWIYDLGLRHEDLDEFDVADVRARFEDTLAAVWRGEIENDRFNRLVLRAGLRGRDATVLRAYVRYLRQAGTTFSRDVMATTLVDNPEIAALLVELFAIRFDPDRDVREDRGLAAKEAVAEIERRIDLVARLNEDRVLRSLLNLVTATLRTNFFTDGATSLVFKLDPHAVPDLPLPRPAFETFVYSPLVEGVYLRGGPIARGGLRWSDRPEDFRTEILGLVGAQSVTNAVAVPVGAKGGFVVKSQADVATCYRTFVRGLLDVTDNMVDGRAVPPRRVVRHDGDDPYLVVAADKGTAEFADIANAISAEYGFWLGDAFASGGSTGYDRKAMGITARGAWVSVRRHFRSLGIDVQDEDFTVAGIGNMSGDVFGNGMLLSRHIRLVAAFDHRHVFVDPDPDPGRSFDERARLFRLARSSWADYDRSLISAGGGVFPRTARDVPLSDEMRRALGVDADSLSADELVRAVLESPVDLLWNGGVGTYVKASAEPHGEVGDKRNDAVRVDATGLRCRVAGEGGSSGFTQRGRTEYALLGGQINADVVDGAAAVNCSDREVNIKILLDRVVRDGDLTGKQRDELLAAMTDEVAADVLADSDGLTRAIHLDSAQAPAMRDVHARYLDALERSGRVDRAAEQLPGTHELMERAEINGGLQLPEFALLLAHSKIELFDDLIGSDVPEDPFLGRALERYFPRVLRDRCPRQIQEHPLRREIIATRVANGVVDRAGMTFVSRLTDETGLSAPDVARAHTAAWDVFGMGALWERLEALDGVVPTRTQISLFLELRRLAERATRWLLRNREQPLDIAQTIEFFEPGVRELTSLIPALISENRRSALDRTVRGHVDAGVPEELARAVRTSPDLISALDITAVARSTGRPVGEVAVVHFALEEHLRLDWLRARILDLPRDERWPALARAALREDLHVVHSAITAEVVRTSWSGCTGQELVRDWIARTDVAANRCLRLLDEIGAAGRSDLATVSVALREIRTLVRASGG